MTNPLHILADRVEGLSRPCRETDAAIALAIGKKATIRYGDPALGNDYWAPGYFEHYTKSIDAAMTLVPEGYDWIIARTNGGLTVHATVGEIEYIFGATPALALAAASIRAIAANQEKDGE